jgi:hypothetical protein
MKHLKIKLSQKKFIHEMKDFLEEVELKEDDDVELVLSICNTCEMKFRQQGCGDIKKESVIEILKSRMGIEFLDQTIEFICNQGLIIKKTCWRRFKYFLKKQLLGKNLLTY